MKQRLLLFFLFLQFGLGAQENYPVGARQAALANAAVTLTDVWSAHHNQAGLGHIRHLTAGVYYENRFLIPELGLAAAAIAIPVSQGSLGISIRNFGYKLYQESKIGLGYGRKFGENLSIGMQLNYHQVRIADIYGNKSLFTAEVGALYQLGKNLVAAAHVYNPGQPRLSEFGDERLPAAIRFGLRYQFSEKIMLATEAEKGSYHNPMLRLAMEYRILGILSLRAGISSNPVNSSFGFGIHAKKLLMDFAGAYHPVLGLSPKLALTYAFGE